MRDRESDNKRLEDILHAIDIIQQYLLTIHKQDLENESVYYFAVIKNIEIIGEAANSLSEEMISKRPDVNWRSIIDMRHFMVHHYFDIDVDIVWNTVINDLLPLKTIVNELLTGL